MSCYHPLRAYRRVGGRDPVTGKWPLTFKKSEGWLETAIDIPCGTCVGCRMDYARGWALRCVHESKLHKDNCCITLTYDDDNLPDDGELDKRGMQNWLKILRYHIGSFRYFGCGEYGKMGDRPHYHIILFGYDFPDKRLITTHLGTKQYDSAMLRDIWHRGHISVGQVDFRTAAYIARYCLKKQKGGDNRHQQQEYILMSNRPGIGADWVKQFSSDVFSAGRIVTTNGNYKVPKYYEGKLDQIDHERFVEYKRGHDVELVSPLRAAQQEIVKKERLKDFKRSFEDV
nr:replication initiation protein [Gokushovirinae sp.]